MTRAKSKQPQSPGTDWAQAYLDVAEVMILVIGVDQTVRLINKKGCRVLGYPEEEIVGKNWFESFLPEHVKGQVQEVFAQLVSGKVEPVVYSENSVLTSSGDERLISWQNTLLYDEKGQILGTMSSGSDVTERKKHEVALRRSEAELRAIVENAVDGIVTIDPSGTIQSFNPAAEEIFGYSSDEVIGKNVKLLMPEPDHSQHDEYISNYLKTRQRKIIGIGREVMGQRKDGSTLPLHLAVSEIRLDDRVMFTALVHDLTGFKRMQEEVLQARNLAAIGEMAASVAHEIKNPLAGISGAIHVLRDNLAADESLCEVLDEILLQVKRLDNSVRDLLLLSKPWKPEKQICDVRALVEDIVSSASRQEAFDQVKFLFSGESKLEVDVDPVMFEQVLWNLLHNAAQAMPEGGQIECLFGREEDSVIIMVADTGDGIPFSFQDRLFRPFFTTKTQGTGLGLTICKNIIEAHNGSIIISSQPDKGTEAILRLPKS